MIKTTTDLVDGVGDPLVLAVALAGPGVAAAPLDLAVPAPAVLALVTLLLVQAVAHDRVLPVVEALVPAAL